MYLDPTKTRISTCLLLSDLMGCDSVYRYGYRNRFDANWTDKLAEGAYLGSLLDSAQGYLGPFSVSYGFISPELSRKIVTYQNPDKPSYHRWDLGAAADVCFHEWVETDSPIKIAFEVDRYLNYSRMITYSESEWICLGTRLSESDGQFRRAFYENRYIGERKPKFVSYSANSASRARQIANHCLEHDWRGQGWPSYHGGGRRQFEHYRTSLTTCMSDFLYDNDCVFKGIKNLPPFTKPKHMERWRLIAAQAGLVLDAIATDFNSRTSITAAYRDGDKHRNWYNHFTLELVPNAALKIEEIAAHVESLPEVSRVWLQEFKDGERRIRVKGHTL